MSEPGARAARTGRPHSTPYDKSPPASASIDVDVRIGWLLQMNRRYGADPALARADEFLSAAEWGARRPARSQLTRWEQGTVPVPADVIETFSAILGRPPAALSAFAGWMRGSAIGRTRSTGSAPVVPARTRLQELIEQARSGCLQPAEWMELADGLRGYQAVFIDDAVWWSVVRQLLVAMCHSTGDSYVVLSLALTRILSVEGAEPFVVDAVSEIFRDPHAQVVIDPIGAFERSTGEASEQMLLQMLRDPLSDRELQAASWTTANRLSSGLLSPAALAALPAICVELFSETGTQFAAAELLAALTPAMRADVLRRVPGRSRTELNGLTWNRETAAPAVASAVASTIATAANAAHERDGADIRNRMLESLVREGLFHVTSERRHQAWLTIMMSPLRPAVAAELAALVRVGRQHPHTLARALAGLSYLAGPAELDWLLAYANRPDVPVGERAGAIRTVGHIPGRERTEPSLLQLARGPDETLAHAALYALGMSRTGAVRKVVADHDLPADRRAAARWWLRLHEVDACPGAERMPT